MNYFMNCNVLNASNMAKNSCVYSDVKVIALPMLVERNSDARMQQLIIYNCLTFMSQIFTLASARLPKLNRGMNLRGAVCLTKFCMEQKT